jgi:hypothetical protein
MYAAGDKIKDQLEMARLGAREGTLPWSRSKLTAAHMRDALKNHKEGNREKALYHANLALDLDPTTTEAMKLKEELTGKRTYWPDNGVVEDSINEFIKSHVDETAPVDGGSSGAAPTTQPSSAGKTAEAPATQPAEQTTPTAELGFDPQAGPGGTPAASVETDTAE